MKRTRELEQAVEEIVREGKRKNEKGQPLYPVVHEPAVLVFFGAPEALFEVLLDRPLLVLNLLQTNKALQSFFAHFPRIWIQLSDALIEKSMGSYAAEIYPFFEIQWEKEDLGLDRKVMFIDIKKRGVRYHQFYLKDTPMTYNEEWEDPEELQSLIFYAVKPDDTWLSDYVEMLNLFDKGRYGGVRTALPVTNTTFWSMFSDFLVLVQKGAEQQLSPPRYYEVGRVREEIDKIVVAHSWRYGHSSINYLADKLMDMLSNTVSLATPPIVKLDEKSVAEYRTQLYGEKGLYPTSEAQKIFFFRIVRALSDIETKDEMIRQYGDAFTFNCLVCKQETELVDPQLLHAFCGASCRSNYSQ